MKRKNGFTLIELLAVIVILAIIALIATPIVLNMINSARKKAAESSAYGFIDAIEYNNGFAQTEQAGYTEINGTDLDATSINVKMKGKKPTSGTVTIVNGKVTSATGLCFNDYKVNYDGRVATVGGKCDGSSSNPEPVVTTKCKKATVLTTHGTDTFGSLVSGSTLISGNALDCDVDGTGYNKRFYYVTDLEGNSDYAVLIYNKNVSVQNNVLSDGHQAIAYYSAASENWHGPTSAINYLPTTTQWSNITLANTSRAIKSVGADWSSNPLNENSEYLSTTSGGTLPTNFSYAGKAARLLTVKEVISACSANNTVTNARDAGYLDNCKYFLENTDYTDGNNSRYWLETPVYSPSDSQAVWYIRSTSSSRAMDQGGVTIDSVIGVRPAIEVRKSEIDLS